MSAVTLENVTISYARHPAVHHVSGTFKNGSLTAVAGPNGAGKSTLLKAIAGIIEPDEGSIRIEGGERRHIAYLPQASELERGFPLSILHLVATGYWHKAGGSGAITSDMKRQVAKALSDVGLSGFEQRPLSSLSVGQFQRALFARLLVQDAPLILLDEPFTAIDTDTTTHLIELVERWHKEGRTVICVLHDFNQIRGHFPECLLMARECIAWGSAKEVLASEQLLAARSFHEGAHAADEACRQAV
jgi:zinc/manganese transport system ATP-binding protein